MTGPIYEEKRQIFERFLPGKLSPDEIDTLSHFARVESYRAGKEIYAKGSLGRSMMAVLRGRAKMASVSRDGKEIVFNIMHPGEIFGEIALLDGGQRSADAIAMTDCEILVLDRRDFTPLLEKRADICLVLLRILCQRLRQTSEQVEECCFGTWSRGLPKPCCASPRTPLRMRSRVRRSNFTSPSKSSAISLAALGKASIKSSGTGTKRAGASASRGRS